MAVARRAGYPAGGRIWDYPAADVDKVAYLFYVVGVAGSGVYCDDLREGVCAE